MPRNKEKRAAYCKNYGADWYQRNKEQVKAASNDRKRRLRTEWVEYKASLSCTRCGASHPAIIDFHHNDPSEKEHNIFRLASKGAVDKLKEELKKCTVLCANCHRIHHFDELQAKRALKRATEQDNDHHSS